MSRKRLDLPDSAALIAGAAPGGRLSAPSAERNIGPILEVLERVAPPEGRALEIASGTGQHIVRFAKARPKISWQPSDAVAERFASVRAWIRAAGLANVADPRLLNAAAPWPGDLADLDLVIAVNLLHLVSDEAAAAILANMADALAPGGVFCLYGPFLRAGRFASNGDRAFHASLKAQDPGIGYKDAGWVMDLLAARGMESPECHEMPASNLMMTARKTGSA